jgi:hypothetical protein
MSESVTAIGFCPRDGRAARGRRKGSFRHAQARRCACSLSPPRVPDPGRVAALPQYNTYMRRLFPLPRYARDAARLLDAKGQDEMERHVADDPERYPLIPGGTGMRKARWAGSGRGKSGGVRVNLLFRGAGRRVLHCGVRQE